MRFRWRVKDEGKLWGVRRFTAKALLYLARLEKKVSFG
jgi:hypothetical protein